MNARRVLRSIRRLFPEKSKLVGSAEDRGPLRADDLANALQVIALVRGLADGVRSQLDRCRQLQSAVRDSIDSMASASERSAQVADLQNEILGRLSGGIDSLLDRLGSVGEMARTTEVRGQECRDSATETRASVASLSRVRDQIDDEACEVLRIARSTNLLALNAAIEACRSDAERGGFAVIAREVRTLATSSATSVDSISGALTALTGSLGEVEASLAWIEERTDSLAKLQTDVAVSIGTQLSETAVVGDELKDLRAAVEALSTESRDMCRLAELCSSQSSELESQNESLESTTQFLLSQLETIETGSGRVCSDD